LTSAGFASRTSSEDEIERRLADDPWTVSEQLEVTSIEPWSVFVDAKRLTPEHAAA
jgi:hypothetical protein